jgi:phosphopantetheinyl transferase
MKNGKETSQAHAMAALSAACIWDSQPPRGCQVAALQDHNLFDDDIFTAVLSEAELQKAANFSDQSERRHYIVKRSFQRLFVKTVLNWPGAPETLNIVHQLDTQPKCLDAPQLNLSFSSSGATFVAGCSTLHALGVDVEKRRHIENIEALAQRFFTPEEAELITTMHGDEQNDGFLKHWTTKEAGLKSIGKGIVSGLNSFVLKLSDQGYLIQNVPEFENTVGWRVDFLDFLPQHIVAVVHNFKK